VGRERGNREGRARARVREFKGNKGKEGIEWVERGN
jgi:hypothetical protein